MNLTKLIRHDGIEYAALALGWSFPPRCGDCRARRTLTLTPAQHRELERLRDHGPKPYLRERAAALLKVAAGQPATVVARQGLLRRRRRESVYSWLTRYQAEGLAGLYIRPGRGRKPAFSPSARRRGAG